MLLLASPAAFAQLAGAYTIDSAQPTGGTNYASFGAAAAALTASGVSGPVTFAVSGGPYTEQLSLGPITGSSATNRVTFNGQGRTIQFGSTNAAQKAVITLSGADYVTLDSLTVDATVGGTSTAAYGWGIQVLNNADYCIIRKCAVTTSTSATTSSFAGIVSSASSTDATTAGSAAPQHLTLSGNTVQGGYYGIAVVGTGVATAGTPGIVVRGNTLRDFHYYGIFASYLTSPQLLGNDISRPTRTALTTFYGISLGAGVNGAAVEKNRIHRAFPPATTSTSGAFAMFMSTGTTITGKPNVVANNLVYDLGGAGSVYGFYNASSSSMRYYYNTVDINDPTSTTASNTYGFYQTSAQDVVFQNNLVHVTRAGLGTTYAVYLSSAAGTTVSDHNNLMGSGTNFKTGYYAGVPYATLADWQTANGSTFDRASVAVAPQFGAAAAGNLLPGAAALSGAAVPLAQVSEDITGAARSLTAPDIGAYEFTPALLKAWPTTSEQELAIFPNPSATGQLTLRLPASNRLGTATLLDAVGRVVRQQPLGRAEEQSFSTVGVAPGFYTLRVQNNAAVLSEKVVLQ
ncbi:MAG TPA: T9SS type A sorting domain-containing protein [Hymenobacter sp.]|uniref:T9SS type A sorting domain-containing protein n=1 Tax=Hymenobacter sp. TaxID=1898978 RepID=UPI002D7E9503|nr:T9SS type A sorting domain-containing protein [Hymenobacter sp.]HET9503064.1 T9SS type A sorting domain-containing protein [Hymenobacter sp.]